MVEKDNDNELFATMSKTLDGLLEVVRTLVETQGSSISTVKELRRELINLSHELHNINKTLYLGNGQQAIVSRVAVLEGRVDEAVKDLSHYINDLKERDRIKVQKDQISSKGKWAIVVAIVSGLLGLVGSAINALQ